MSDVKAQVKQIMDKCQQDISEAIGKPVSIIYRIKVNQINPQLIINNVCGVCRVSYSALISKSQERELVVARHLVMWLVTYYCGLNDAEVGKLVNRDRTSVVHAIDKVNDMLDTKDQLYLVPLDAVETQLLQVIKDKQ